MAQQSPYTPRQQRELNALADLFTCNPDREYRATHRQLSLAAKVPEGSMQIELARAGLKPLLPGTSYWRAGDLRDFVAHHLARVAAKEAAKVVTENPRASDVEITAIAHDRAVKINKLLLDQPRAE